VQFETHNIGCADLTVAPGRILKGEVAAPPEMSAVYSALRVRKLVCSSVRTHFTAPTAM
jgi:hypothetical protein